MPDLRIGSLFSGYGGLDCGVQSVLGGTVAWHSEIDPGACKILAHRYPDVPNLGDITVVDWSQVEPVDVITGGSPCQDVSAAGKRAGMRAGTRSGLWASMCDAIDIIRPSLVVWENVRGVLSAGADSAVEPCPICVGDERESHLRALGRVVGDLAELGYVGRWTGLRAADVGAPHGRFRVFVVAWPAQDADVAARGERRLAASAQTEGWGARANARRRGGAPAATGCVNCFGTCVFADNPDSCTQYDPAADAHRDAVREQPVSLTGRGSAPVVGLAGAEVAPDSPRVGRPGRELSRQDVEQGGSQSAHDRAPGRDRVDWGAYGPAVHRWERVLGRVAPPPTETGAKGQPRLSPAFVEWMMGLPAGWVTDVPGLTRNEQLKALGNGVVPQQAAAALRLLLPDVAERAA